uniref:Capsid maturation protease n=1 Tax=Mycobacterium phage Pharb TaxID=3136626 RepID=A0AAU8GQ46_9VIRU
MTEGPKAVPQFQGALTRLSSEVGGAVDKLVPRLGGLTKAEGLRFITDAYPTIVDPFLAVSGDLTAQWYAEQTPALVPSVRVRPGNAVVPAKAFLPEPAALPESKQLAASGRWALLQRDPAKALQGSATRSLFAQSRRTVLDNAGREGVKWTRYASGNACGFCRMLATRALTAEQAGAPGLYNTKRSASENAHTFDLARGHDHCKCIAVPVRSGTYEPPAYVHDWLDDYNAVARDDNGALLPEWTIARRMEQRADERLGRAKRGPGRPRKPVADARTAAPAAADAQAPAEAVRARVQDAQHLTDRTAQRAEAFAQPVRDRVQTAQQYAQRADEIASKAAQISGQVKQYTDIADKVLGHAVPVVRDLKAVVDATDKALQTAAQVTDGAVQVTNLAAQAVDSTVDIAHGVKQIADEVGGVLDDAAAVALGVRALVTDTGKAVRDTAQNVKGARSIDDFAEQIAAAVDTATQIQADGLALVDQARGVVDSAQGIAQGVKELPDVMRKPLADVQQMAEAVRGAVADVEQAGDDAAGVARAVQRLVETVADWRKADQAAEAARPPVFVPSERLDAPRSIEAAPRAIEATPQRALDAPERAAVGGTTEVPAIEAAAPLKELPAPVEPLDVEVVALPRVPERLAIEAGPTREQLEDLDGALAEPFGEPPAPAKPKRARKPQRTLDEIEAELNAAIELDDGEAIDRLADEMDRVEKRLKAAAARNEAAKAKRAAARSEREAAKEAAERARWEQMGELVDKGWDEDEAEAYAFGLEVEDVRKRNFMRDAQRDGHNGNTFTKVLKQKFYALVDEAYWKAEAATNGHMIARKYEGKVSPTLLWHMSERDARKYMSEEMANWFDENGRLTFMAYRQAVLDGHEGRWRNAMTPDYNQ